MKKEISQQNFYTALLFVAVICVIFAAGCASTTDVQSSPVKTSTPSTGKIYSVTLENGEKQQMTEAEFRAYQETEDAKKKQPQNPTAKKVEKKEKEGNKGETPKKSTSPQTYTEEQLKSTLLDAKVEDKQAIADLTRQKNELADKVRELEAANEQLSAQVQQLQERLSASSSESRTTTGRSTQQIYPLTEVAIYIGYLILGLCALGVLYGACIACFKAVFSWLTWVATLFLVIPVWWFTKDGWLAAAVGGGFLFVALTLRWWKQRKASKEELLKRCQVHTETPPAASEATAEDPSTKQQPVEEAQIQEPGVGAASLLKRTASLTPPAANGQATPSVQPETRPLSKSKRKK